MKKEATKPLEQIYEYRKKIVDGWDNIHQVYKDEEKTILWIIASPDNPIEEGRHRLREQFEKAAKKNHIPHEEEKHMTHPIFEIIEEMTTPKDLEKIKKYIEKEKSKAKKRLKDDKKAIKSLSY